MLLFCFYFIIYCSTIIIYECGAHFFIEEAKRFQNCSLTPDVLKHDSIDHLETGNILYVAEDFF